jgi:hypothetical protein
MELRISQDDEEVGYLRLPTHPGDVPGAVARSVRLRGLLGEYEGSDIQIDFDVDNRLIGIEIVG